jgi:SAM-dependent methyltransferase
VTGLDRSPELVAAARALAGELGASVEWLERDLRLLAGLGPFDAALCLFTVFGYFSDAENEAVLRGIYELLAPGGQLLLDVDNPHAIVPHLPREHWSEAPRGVRRERHEYDALSGRMLSDRRLLAGSGTTMKLPRSSVRLYYPHELRALLARAGFAVEQLHGGLRGRPFDAGRSLMQSWIVRRP